MYQKVFKPFIDFFVSLITLIILSPIFIVVVIGLTIANKGKPFFFQKRPGKNESIFSIIKFKSMNDKEDSQGNLLSDAQRLTRMGAIVRKTSIDEVPQLINVLKGDMSLIGPRPLLTRYLPYYTEKERLRHTVKPGITGWAQVNGRNTVNWSERLALDIYYVKNLTFLLDIKIVFKTIGSILSSKDIVVDPESIMENLDDERRNENY